MKFLSPAGILSPPDRLGPRVTDRTGNPQRRVGAYRDCPSQRITSLISSLPQKVSAAHPEFLWACKQLGKSPVSRRSRVPGPPVGVSGRRRVRSPFSGLSPREGAARILDPRVSPRWGFSVNASALVPLARANGKRSAAPRGLIGAVQNHLRKCQPDILIDRGPRSRLPTVVGFRR
jgi:hypothetical protein